MLEGKIKKLAEEKGLVVDEQEYGFSIKYMDQEIKFFAEKEALVSFVSSFNEKSYTEIKSRPIKKPTDKPTAKRIDDKINKLAEGKGLVIDEQEYGFSIKYKGKEIKFFEATEPLVVFISSFDKDFYAKKLQNNITKRKKEGDETEGFDVYKHPVRGYEAVKRGFSWPAFFFTWIWAFIKRLWGVGIAFLVLIPTLSIALEEVPVISFIVIISVGLWLGVKGNEWRGNNLKKRGFEYLQTFKAKTPDAAIAAAVKGNIGEND